MFIVFVLKGPIPPAPALPGGLAQSLPGAGVQAPGDHEASQQLSAPGRGPDNMDHYVADGI